MDDSPVVIRRLTPADAEEYARMNRDSLRELPLTFSVAPEDDAGSDVEQLRDRLASSRESAVFGAFAPNLIGSVGLYREPRRKNSHKARIFGVYVLPSWRSRGIGRRLLMTAIDHAREMPGVTQLQLSVSEYACEAVRLYQNCDFRIWGREPRAFCHEGQCVTMLHMVLALD